MEDFIAHNSRWRVGGLVLVSMIFVLLGLWMIGAFGPPPTSRRYPAHVTTAIGWFSLVFFGLAAIAWSKKLFGERVQLRIGPPGIRWRPWSDQLIPWTEVEEVTTWSVRGQQFIVLHLRNPEMFPGRGLAAKLAGASRRMTGGDISISLTGTDRSFADALSAIKRFRG